MVIKQIRNSFGNNDIWISVDETTDRLGRCIAHLVIGKLSSEEAVRPFLLALKQLDKTKSNTISRFLNESLALLWPKGTEDKKVKWFVSDGTSYMIKTDTNLKCLNYLDVNGIISNVKTIFLKAPIRVDFYKNSLPNTPLPPEPVLIRWGTWIQAALFYADHFHVLKQVVMSLEATDAQCIKKAQEFLNKANVKNELLYIKTHFKIIADAIEQLETIGLKLNQSVEIVEKVYTSLKNTPGKVGEMAFQNVLYLLKKNPGYDFICSVNNVICGAAAAGTSKEVEAVELNSAHTLPLPPKRKCKSTELAAETDETSVLSLSELQRLVLLEQLKLIKMQQKEIENKRERE
ncbi:hypothetical protein Zmor_021891 [Zophobas morio]|uniref:DUF659 domain-containing protein n=1 Tax=Zophobas morio TaxID=2755281 RepID=A0AA38I3C4_9CUCU|nr:hypothetical protein Zmor_021891 [Zophobas morio]